jgi:diguanylate cyclase (GGDEF)-like protein
MKLTEFLAGRSKATITAAALLAVLGLGVVDYLNGPDVSFLVFYTAPLYIATWYGGRRVGLLVCAAIGLSWFLVAYLTSGHFIHPLIAYWNAAVRLGFMLLMAHVVGAFKKSLEQEREAARTDYLTGAVNSRHFAELAAAEIGRARRHGHSFSVAYMDVDDFKMVNDCLGHSAGDRLLKSVAETIRREVRSIDVVARLGGDEFAVLMPETGEDAARAAITRLRQRLALSARSNGWPVTFSIGVATWDEPPASFDEMLRRADELMYAAKRQGKNTVRHSARRESVNAA